MDLKHKAINDNLEKTEALTLVNSGLIYVNSQTITDNGAFIRGMLDGTVDFSKIKLNDVAITE